MLSTDTEEIGSLLENVLMGLSPDTKDNHTAYLDGYLNCLLETGQISEATYSELKPIYVDLQG